MKEVLIDILRPVPEDQVVPKPQPPHKWWRACWQSTDGAPVMGNPPCSCDFVGCVYARSPPGAYRMNSDGSRALVGKIYPDAETARMKAEEVLEAMRVESGWPLDVLTPIVLDGVVMVDEHGVPL